VLARHDSATPDRRAIVVRTRHSLAACQRGAHLQQMQMPMHFLLVATVLAAANAFVPSPTKQLARRRAQPRQSASSMKVLRASLPHAHRPPWHCASSCAPAFCSAALPSACVQSHPAKFSAGMSGKGLCAWATRTGCSADDVDVLREGKYDGEKMASSNLRELQQAGVSLEGATRLMDGVEARTGAQQLAVAASPAPDFHCATPLPH